MFEILIIAWICYLIVAGFTSGFIEKRIGEPYQDHNAFLAFICGLIWPLFFIWLLGYWVSEQIFGD